MIHPGTSLSDPAMVLREHTIESKQPGLEFLESNHQSLFLEVTHEEETYVHMPGATLVFILYPQRPAPTHHCAAQVTGGNDALPQDRPNGKSVC